MTQEIFMKAVRSFIAILFLGCLGAAFAIAQHGAPATPLIVHDPYFSIWSTTDRLTDSETSHWTGSAQPINGIARIDGKPFRFMGRVPGRRPDPVPAMEQTASSITPTHTRYEFRQGGVTLELTFFTPAMMNDIDVLSRPVTYLSWTARSNDGAAHQVSLMLDVDPVIAVNDRSEQVVMSRNRTAKLNVLSAGSRDQSLLNRSGDNLRIDWGYFRLAVPKEEDASMVIAPHSLADFVADGKIAASDSISMPQAPARQCPHLAVVLDLGSVSAEPVKRHLLVAYTEDYAIQYLQRNLRPYWQRNDMPVEELLDKAEEQYAALDASGYGLRQGAHRRFDQGWWRALRGHRHSRLSPDSRRAQDCSRSRRHAADVPQGELLQRLHLHRGRHLSFCPVLPLLPTQVA